MNLNRSLSLAPMMSYTDRHFRHFLRLITRHTLLYTEMVVAGTIKHNVGKAYLNKLLHFEPSQQPIAVQLGGDSPADLVLAARICEDFGYAEINLNVGCPSDRVQKGAFGAVLMKEPRIVAELVAAMKKEVRIPVTVKHRIGVDNMDSFDFLSDFVQTVSEAGCSSFAVHARKAWLKGLSPAQNRSVPPLDYKRVYLLKKKFPHLEIILNGGVESLDQVETHLEHIDGVMIGRAAYHNPLLFSPADSRIFGDSSRQQPDTDELLSSFQEYFNSEVRNGTPASSILRHLLGFFKGESGSRLWRQKITEAIQRKTEYPPFAELYRDTIGRFAEHKSHAPDPIEKG